LSLGALLFMSDNSVIPDNAAVKKTMSRFETRVTPTRARLGGHKEW
jgi:hypothetical protein